MEGVIQQFGSVINLGALNLTTMSFLFKFNDDVSENRAILDYFVHHDYTDAILSLSGQWDLSVEFICMR